MLTPRLALRIYLVGLLQLAIIAVGFDFLVRRIFPRGPHPAEGEVRYLAHHLEHALATPGGAERELETVARTLRGTATLVLPDGTRLSSGRGLECAEARAENARTGQHRVCIDHRIRLPDGRTANLAFVTAAAPNPGRLLVGFVPLALLVVGVGTWVFSRTVTRPLAKMCAAARAFGQGELGARVRETRHDELGALAKSFDEMADRVTALLAAEKELLASVSHELRTPLARIRVALDLGTEGDPDTVRESLREIGSDLGELERLIDDLLTATRLDLAAGVGPRSTTPLKRAPVPLGGVITEAVRRFRAAHPDRPLQVTGAENLPTASVDPVLLRRAFDNLLENAHKYSPDPDDAVELSIRIGDAVTIEVVDRGIGIDEADLESVFRPFYRTDRSRSRKTGGLGLGLALAKRIVQAHDGTIELASSLERGTRVIVQLPHEGSSIAGSSRPPARSPA